jgi:hypothetical protein
VTKRVYQWQVDVLLKFEPWPPGGSLVPSVVLPWNFVIWTCFCSCTYTRCIRFHHGSRLILSQFSKYSSQLVSWDSADGDPHPRAGRRYPAELSHDFTDPPASKPPGVITTPANLIVQHRKLVRKHLHHGTQPIRSVRRRPSGVMGGSLILHSCHECRSGHPGPDLVKGWGSRAHDSGRYREWHRVRGAYTVDQGEAPSIGSRISQVA